MTTTLAFDIIAKDKASSTVESFGGKLDGMAKTAVAAGAAIGGAGVAFAAFGQALDKEKSLDRMSAALGSTPRQAEKMGRVASGLYAGAWGESMDEVATSVEAVSSSFSGLSKASDLKRVTAQAMDFATVFGVDMPKATMVAATVMKSGLAKSATEAFDLMTAASQRVPASLREDVLDASEEYGQFFAGLGFSGEQAFAMLAKGAEKGQYGIDKIGDAIKEFTIRATDGSKATTTAYTAMGLDADAMANKIVQGGKGAASATSDIVAGLLKIKDPAQQAQMAISLFGTPLEDLNVKDIPAFLQSMQKGTKGMDDWKGSIDRAGQTLNDNASTNIESFKRKVSTTFVDFIGGKVLPVLSDFAASASDDVGPAFDAIGNNLDTIGPALGVVVAGMTLFKTVSLAAAAASAVQAAGTTAATGATWSLNAALRANPIGIVITALTALGVGFVVAYKKSETFRTVVDGALNGVKKGFDALGRAGTWLWNNALQPAFKFIVNGVGSILDLWSTMLGQLAKVPGFGWAKAAAEAMGNAADNARDMAAGIQKIPNKTVTVTVAYKYTGLRGPGGSGPTRGGPSDLGILPRGARATAATIGRDLMEALAGGIKDGGKKLDKVLMSSRDRIKSQLSQIRDDMKSMSESIASAINPTDFGGGIAELMASLTGNGSMLDGLQSVWATLSGSVSKDFLSSLMQSGNVGLATALGNDPAAAAAASAQYDANAAKAGSLGDQTATAVLGDKIESALAREMKNVVDELKQLSGKTARELRKEIEDLRLEVTGLSPGQRAHIRGGF